MRRFHTLILAVSVVLSACATGGGEDAASSNGLEHLAEQPTALAETPAGVKGKRDPKDRPADKEGTGAKRANRGPAENDAADADEDQGSGPQPISYRGLVSRTDAVGDVGRGPRYADLASFLLEASTRELRATLVFDGALPEKLGERETLGIGIDLYREDAPESDFQIFIDGGDDGWFAYLQTPDGFVEYPGTFAKGTDALVITVPWRSLGRMSGGYVGVFVDHSDVSTTPARSSSDYLPDPGRYPFTR